MALTTSRISVLRGRPPGRGAGISGFKTAHWASVISVGYGERLIFHYRQPTPFGTDSHSGIRAGARPNPPDIATASSRVVRESRSAGCRHEPGHSIRIDRRIPIPATTGRPPHGEDVRLERPQPANLRLIQRAGQCDEPTGFLRPTDPPSPRGVDHGPSRLVPGVEEDTPACGHLGGFIDDRPRLG